MLGSQNAERERLCGPLPLVVDQNRHITCRDTLSSFEQVLLLGIVFPLEHGIDETL